MDERLADLCNTCNIYMPGELVRVEKAVEKHGVGKALAGMKRLSHIKPTRRMRMQYPIDNFEYLLRIM